jgi:hypothetical protein
MVDATDLKSVEHCARAGSSPAVGTTQQRLGSSGVEQRTENPCVAGSRPARATFLFTILFSNVSNIHYRIYKQQAL